MPLRSLGDKHSVREPFALRTTPPPARAVEDVRDWYTRGRFMEERARATPETYWELQRWPPGGRTHVVLAGHEYLIEVSFVERDGEAGDPVVSAVAPERAYELALDHDDTLRARGWTIFNERHPKP